MSKSDGLISRQAAIDAFTDEIQVTGRANAESVKAYVKLVIDRIKRLPSAQPMRWIPCSERLPRQGQEVICQCRANMIKVLKLDACGDWYQDAEHCYMSGFVIAWMPLPAPYEERREE